MPLDIRKPKGRPAPIQVTNLVDFTGGLNLGSDTFKLGKTESPDMMNVDIDQRGGFQLRSGVRPASTNESLDIRSMWRFGDRLMVQDDHKIAWSQAGLLGQFYPLTSTVTGVDTVRAAVLNDICYMVTGVNRDSIKWNGITSDWSDLGIAWNDDYATPTDGNMPRAKYVAAHTDYVWVANTSEGGQLYPNRVRWSHPNKAERWRQLDYFDLDVGHDTDVITGIMAHGDQLLVFKDRAVYAVYGYDIDTFQVTPISDSVGALGQDAIVSTPAGICFYDRYSGVYLYDGRQLKWLGKSIFPAIDREEIPRNLADGDVHLGWMKNRLWVTVPFASQVRVSDWTMASYDDSAWGDVAAYVTQGVGAPQWNYQAPAPATRTPLNWPDPTAFWCGPPSGSPADAPIGSWYARWTVTVPTTGSYDLYYAVDNGGELYVDGVLKTNTGNFINYQLIKLDLTAGDHIFAVHSYNAELTVGAKTGGPTAALWALYSGTNGSPSDPYVLHAHSDGSATCLEYQAPEPAVFGPEVKRRTYVWAPVLNKGEGAWQQYDLQMQHYTQAYGERCFATEVGTNHVQELELQDWSVDTFGNEAPSTYPSEDTWPSDALFPTGRTPRHIDAWYRTFWVDQNQPAQRKRWKRMEAVMRGGNVSLLPVEVFTNYNATAWKKTFVLQTSVPTPSDSWNANPGGEYDVIDRGSALGLARSVSLRVHGPATNEAWAVDALVLKYKPKRIR